LAEPLTLIIDADEDLRDLFFGGLVVGRPTYIDGRETIVANRSCDFQVPLDGIFVLLVDSAPLLSKLIQEVSADLRILACPIPQLCHVNKKLGIVTDGSISDFEAPIARSKCYRNFPSPAISSDYLFSSHHCKQGRKTLLTVDDERRSS